MQAFREAVDLDVVSFVATFIAGELVGGNKRKAADFALERNFAGGDLKFEGDFADRLHAVTAISGGFVEAGGTHAFLKEMFQVDVGSDDLVGVGEALGFGELDVVLVDHGVAVPRKVGGGFAGTGGGVEVSGDAFAGLAGAEGAAVIRFADGDVAGAEI